MMGNRVQSFSPEVGSVIIRWYISKCKELVHEMFSCEVVDYVDVLHSRIVDRVPCNVDTRGMICHNRYGDGITELCECIMVPDCLTRCCGKCHIFWFCCRRTNGLLFLREPGYNRCISHESMTRYGTTGIMTRSIITVREGNNGQRN